MKKKIIYYAHPMSWYDTDAERQDLEALASEGTIINPNTTRFNDMVSYAKARNFPVMDVFAEQIRDKADVVCFRRFRDGKIGAGVAREILEALIWGKEVWEIKDSYIDKAVILTGDGGNDWTVDLEFGSILTVDQTRQRIANKEL